MSWFYEYFEVPSAFNGTIKCSRNLGTWQVVVGETGQSGPYLDTMWKRAVRKVPNPGSIRKILVLGLGIGSSLKAYARRFPEASLTVVEIDPVMIELTDRFQLLKGKIRPEILLGDAIEIVPTLTGRYDLIVFDMFIGDHVAPASREDKLIQAALEHLEADGSILVNSYQETDVFARFKKHCCEITRWRYLRNHVALFRPHGAGALGDRLPATYQHAYSCIPFMRREFQRPPFFVTVLAGEVVGIHRRLPFFDFDHFLGDVEPVSRPTKTRPRLTFWQPLSRLDQPAGWKRSPVAGHRRLTGFAQIPSEGDYTQRWSGHAKRHLKRWKKQVAHVLVDTDVETYTQSFRTCGKAAGLIALFSEELARKDKAHPNCLRLRVARDTETGDIIAGFASLWIPEIRQTFHVTSFITPAGRETSAAFALVDDCFRIAQARGDQVLEFDGFHAPGDPSSWKGFSRFKGQFGVFFIRWPKPLIRFD